MKIKKKKVFFPKFDVLIKQIDPIILMSFYKISVLYGFELCIKKNNSGPTDEINVIFFKTNRMYFLNFKSVFNL